MAHQGQALQLDRRVRIRIAVARAASHPCCRMTVIGKPSRRRDLHPCVLVVGRRGARRLTAAGRAMEGFTAGLHNESPDLRWLTSLDTTIRISKRYHAPPLTGLCCSTVSRVRTPRPSASIAAVIV